MDSSDFQVIIRYWLSLSFIDMSDDNQWTRLERALRDGRQNNLTVSELKDTWINQIDPELEMWVNEGSLEPGVTRMKGGTLDMEAKMASCTRRVRQVKKLQEDAILKWVSAQQEYSQNLTVSPLKNVEPESQLFGERQVEAWSSVCAASSVRSGSLTVIVPKRTDLKRKSDSPPLAELTVAAARYQKLRHKTSKLNHAFSMDFNGRSDRKHGRHEIKIVRHIPTVFSAPFHGAPSLDALGSYLPPQRFEGITFHMLTNPGDYGDIASAVGLEYFIKVHGGNVEPDSNRIAYDTIVVVSQDDSLNRKLFHQIHSTMVYPEAVYEFVKNPMYQHLRDFEICELFDFVYWPMEERVESLSGASGNTSSNNGVDQPDGESQVANCGYRAPSPLVSAGESMLRQEKGVREAEELAKDGAIVTGVNEKSVEEGEGHQQPNVNQDNDCLAIWREQMVDGLIFRTAYGKSKRGYFKRLETTYRKVFEENPPDLKARVAALVPFMDTRFEEIREKQDLRRSCLQNLKTLLEYTEEESEEESERNSVSEGIRRMIVDSLIIETALKSSVEDFLVNVDISHKEWFKRYPEQGYIMNRLMFLHSRGRERFKYLRQQGNSDLTKEMLAKLHDLLEDLEKSGFLRNQHQI